MWGWDGTGAPDLHFWAEGITPPLLPLPGWARCSSPETVREARACSPGPLEHSSGHWELGGHRALVAGLKFISRKKPLANGKTGGQDWSLSRPNNLRVRHRARTWCPDK